MGSPLAAAPLLLMLMRAGICLAYEVETTTRLGRVGGNQLHLLGRTVEEYRGIPYARPPLGTRRFLPPQPALPWQGTLDATRRRTACPQAVFSNILVGDLEYTEDCLQLNVWTPAAGTEDLAAVVVWFHGGGFAVGSANYDNYTGAIIAAKTGLVVVSLNYRLGILGFLDADSPESPGNVGLLDQNMALKWIRENIREFGGDPSRVTLLGESAGGMSVHAQVISPVSRHLFSRAFLMSGDMHSMDLFDTTHESIRKGGVVATAVGCTGADLATNPDPVIECLRTKSADQLIVAAKEALAPKVFPFVPTFHNEFFPKLATTALKKGFFNAVDLFLGVTEDEGVLALMYPFREELLSDDLQSLDSGHLKNSLHEAIYSWININFPEMLEKYTAEAPDGATLRRGYVDYLSDSTFVCPMHFTAERHSDRGHSVYTYVFGHMSAKTPLPSWMGTPHAFDINYVFGVPLLDREHFDADDVEVSEFLLATLSNFAATGTPTLPGNKAWPKYTTSNPVSVYISSKNITEIFGFRKEQCNPWRLYV